MMMNAAARALPLALALCGAAWAAEVQVNAPWARATVAAQKATGAFMEITSRSDARLKAVSSPAAGVAELHSMKMEDGVMRMRALPYLDLPAGKPVSLAPGGYHIMLMELRKPLAKGDTLPLSLVVETGDGRSQTIEVSAEVREITAGPMGRHGH